MNFAVETQHQSPKFVAQLVVEVASELGYIFKHLMVLDKLSIGSVEYQRFKVSDSVELDKLLNELFRKGRAVIGSSSDGFEVRTKSRTAKIPISMMQTAPRTSVQYRGPGDQYWKRQFVETIYGLALVGQTHVSELCRQQEEAR